MTGCQEVAVQAAAGRKAHRHRGLFLASYCNRLPGARPPTARAHSTCTAPAYPACLLGHPHGTAAACLAGYVPRAALCPPPPARPPALPLPPSPPHARARACGACALHAAAHLWVERSGQLLLRLLGVDELDLAARDGVDEGRHHFVQACNAGRRRKGVGVQCRAHAGSRLGGVGYAGGACLGGGCDNSVHAAFGCTASHGGHGTHVGR